MHRKLIYGVVVLAVLAGSYSLFASRNDTAAQEEQAEPPPRPVVEGTPDNWQPVEGDFDLGATVDQPFAEAGAKISKRAFEDILAAKGHMYATSIEGIDGEPDCNTGVNLGEKYGFHHDPDRMLCVVIVKGKFEITSPYGKTAYVDRMINIYDGETGAYLGTGTMDLD